MVRVISLRLRQSILRRVDFLPISNCRATTHQVIPPAATVDDGLRRIRLRFLRRRTGYDSRESNRGRTGACSGALRQSQKWRPSVSWLEASLKTSTIC